MLNKMLEIIDNSFPLEEMDVKEYARLKAKGMKFSIKAYKAKGLGHVSVMTAKGFFGLMNMDTLIINATEKDLPLYSYDRVFAMGNDTLIVELYDTVINPSEFEDIDKVNDKYSNIPKHDLGKHWYDSIKLEESVSAKGKVKTDKEMFDKYALEHFQAYINTVNGGADIDSKLKKEKASVYVEGLLKNGGPSTDVFKKALGNEATGELFRNYLFGTK